MNDFTKEDLVLIACWSVNRCEQVGDDQAQDEGTISLSHKIQDMIMNYCEHDWKQGQHLFTDVYCTKCKAILSTKPDYCNNQT